MNEEFWRIQKLSSIPSKSENEILNFRVVPDLQISKKVDFFNDLLVFFDFLFFIKPNPRGAAIPERTPSIRGGLGLPMEMCGHSDGRKGNPRGGVRGSRVRPYVTPLQKEENGSLGGGTRSGRE